MDQAKWCIPRMRGHQISKEMGKFQRPRLKLHAVWGASCGLYLYLVDPRQASDASMVVEAAALTMEKIKRRLGERMPTHLTVICDNTVRENKNNCALAFLCKLVSGNHFQSASMVMARVGHTHNQLGILNLPSRTFHFGVCLLVLISFMGSFWPSIDHCSPTIPIKPRPMFWALCSFHEIHRCIADGADACSTFGLHKNVFYQSGIHVECMIHDS